MQVDIGCPRTLYFGSKDQHKAGARSQVGVRTAGAACASTDALFGLSNFLTLEWLQQAGEWCSSYTDKSSVKREILLILVPMWLGRSPVCFDTRVVQLHIPLEFTSGTALPFKWKPDD